RMGIPHYAVDNDSFLGIFAGTSSGHGVCSINGTGTVAGGIDPLGHRLQVGGIGYLVGDDAGGSYIAHSGVRAVYDSFFRCGEKTLMTEPIFKIMGIQDPSELMYGIGNMEAELGKTEVTRIVFAAAAMDDGPALMILDESARQLAKTSAGCANSLNFGNDIEVVLAGSVWVKAESPALFNSYRKYMEGFLPGKNLSFNLLKEPPATGAVLWALSLCGCDCFKGEVRKKVVQGVNEHIL
ncbi:MAG: N-acetylglucosamine kinase, partial [Defluviitaleaceae bacterium]|nr:N-acetylglucosamine kinase [Defluviitaleaceae bacterium]